MAQASALGYEVVEGWEQLPTGYEHRDVAGVAVDSEDRVYLICRGDHPIIIYDRKGSFLGSWGQGEFTYRTHGITVGPDEMLYCTDDGNHTVRKFTPAGKLLMTLGTMNTPSDTGYNGKDTGTVSERRTDAQALLGLGSDRTAAVTVSSVPVIYGGKPITEGLYLNARATAPGVEVPAVR